MKNKKSLYILIPLVFIVWGLIFWKFFSAKNTQPKQNFVFQEDVNHIDSFPNRYLINVNYPDPFIRPKNQDLRTQEIQQKKNQIKPIKQTNLLNIQYKPNLKYFGCIICKNKKTGIIEINSKNYLVSEQSNGEEFYVVSICEDSLIIKVNEIYHTYFKQN